MRTREKKLTDHGVFPGDEDKLRNRCLTADGYDRELLMDMCKSAAPGLEQQVFTSLTTRRNGYDTQMKKDYVPVTKADFYAYQREAMAEFYHMLRLLGRWEDERCKKN